MLEIKRVYKSFGGISAISDLEMTVEKGEIVGLIGPNGAGKTTAFNLITGYLRPNRGDIVFNGETITGLKPHLIAKKGLVRTFQGGAIYPDFSVLQNITASHYLKPKLNFWESLFHTPGSKKKESYILKQSHEIMRFLGLDSVNEQIAINLAQGYKKILSIAIAMATEARFLLLDEPLSGMNAEEVDKAMGLIKKIWKSKDITILLIEHNMRAAMSLCQRIIVLEMGSKIAEGKPEEIKKNKKVIEAYLGTEGINAA